ncbi:MAG: Tripartite ATP-independent periplasmic transporter dctq component [candidate division WS6 bacterium 34_10]|jgi:TRAP-type C4-dicarboxylate transport system permease small subunit|uniref:Tripartite ATP-independent periplasmic transporter dctq component n=1 Tax=candidate division WS6 bacterium 34_10 TaxID=1641389 RepID=A0A117M0D7_9BACT|nr:MAG: Tripartite ATP-independent periplasmic transporter dctq component [candidate division WS6 bacterium 34_10]
MGGIEVNKFMKFYEIIGKMEHLIASSFLVIMVIIIFSAGFGRSIGYPIRWAIDASTFLFAWAAFFSADLAMRYNRHVNVEIIINRLPQRAQNYLNLVNYSIITIFLLFLIGYGIQLSYITRFRAYQGIPGFSYTWVTLSIPVGCFFLLITILLKMWKLIKSEKIQIFHKNNSTILDKD